MSQTRLEKEEEIILELMNLISEVNKITTL